MAKSNAMERIKELRDKTKQTKGPWPNAYTTVSNDTLNALLDCAEALDEAFNADEITVEIIEKSRLALARLGGER